MSHRCWQRGLREFTYGLRGVQRAGRPEAKAGVLAAIEAKDWGRVNEVLGEIVSAMTEQHAPIAVFTVDPQLRTTHAVSTHHFGDVFREVCVPALRDAIQFRDGGELDKPDALEVVALLEAPVKESAAA